MSQRTVILQRNKKPLLLIAVSRRLYMLSYNMDGM
ncbi:hypothetical protein CBM2609_B70150 [Cupriavidus taiwanensis]|nr:hypothetical protein CBM2604_B60147 [Cupriavidus taiwanensis]SOZ33206.1 hypothetical protein CBM2609_B70150 [Cupriavidus taiwanensis]SOZ48518.1 hypothetical protein CBM2610_B50147 [Cupriavidus taiwanensis]